MKATLKGVSKVYSRLIFKNINFTFEEGGRYVILGKNGSGKSTLLKIIANFEPISEGTIKYFSQEIELKKSEIYSNFSLVAPYISLLDFFTVEEMLNFQFGFRSHKVSKSEIIKKNALQEILSSYIKDLSSGWIQKLKLILSFNSNSQFIMLDEPLTNLDYDNKDWYNAQIKTLDEKQTLIIASNDEREYLFESTILNIEDYK